MLRNRFMCEVSNMSSFSLLLISILCVSTILQTESQVIFDAHLSSLKTYIIHVEKSELAASDSVSDLENYYNSFLPETARGESIKNQRLVYSYQHVASGFAARLTEEEVKAMEGKEGFLAAVPDRMLQLHTTHTPSFLGLNQNLGFVNGSNFGSGVIIGVLDTGILPTHPSFDDQGMAPPPAKWKGKCEFSSCNNKLIGARNFDSFTKPSPPTDDEGHGTHTSSTAGGNFVKDANVAGNANGTATGMAPRAHLAMYKVCGDLGCAESDILAAMDAAVADGVDILSLSLGGPSAPFYSNSLAVGAFGAIQNGVLVSCSAGNSGPFSSSMSNEAPWILTVGASTVDRKIVATAKLGNGSEFDGESLYQPKDFLSIFLPLVYAGQNGNASSAVCAPGSLGDEVKGTVVLCERGGNIGRIAKGQTVKDAGGAAMILMNEEEDGYSTLADYHVLPATHLSYAAGLSVKAYINSTSNPTATILFKGTVIGDATAPMVASFSSRGPSIASPGILKPDIIGPGVSILAAWPVSVNNDTSSDATFNMISGTSMSCPHLSGIAALLKSAHPEWSPAAIKSAIMTTANIQNLGNNPIYDQRLLPADLFAIGAGHVNPTKANDPGLIYDLSPDDYLPYLCGLGYNNSQVSTIAHKTVDCSQILAIPEAELNYPSFSFALSSSGSDTANYTRTVTNVGKANSYYKISYVAPQGVDVNPSVEGIQFSALGQQQTFSVSFSNIAPVPSNTYAQGYLKLVSDDNKYTVQSPISVKFT